MSRATAYKCWAATAPKAVLGWQLGMACSTIYGVLARHTSLDGLTPISVLVNNIDGGSTPRSWPDASVASGRLDRPLPYRNFLNYGSIAATSEDGERREHAGRSGQMERWLDLSSSPPNAAGRRSADRVAGAALVLAFIATTGRSNRFLLVALPAAALAILLGLLVLRCARKTHDPAGLGQATAAIIIGAVALLIGLNTTRSTSAEADGGQHLAGGAATAPPATQAGPWMGATTIAIVTQSPPEPSPLRPDSIAASMTAPPNVDSSGSRVTYAAGNVLDQDPTTAWRVPGTGLGQTLTARWSRRVQVTSLGLLPGYAKRDPYSGVDRFRENRRVRAVRYRFSNGSSVQVRFSDSPRLQRHEVDVVTSSITVEIISTTNGRRDFAAISELAVTGREVP